MRKFLLLGLVVTTLLFFSGTAFALSYATNVRWNGVAISGSDRSDPDNALGAPDGDFLSLGLGGVAAFDFGTSFDATAIVFEVTWGNRDSYPEYAKVFVGNDFTLDTGDYEWVGTIQNNVDQNVIDLSSIVGSPFRYVLVQDYTQESGGIIGDGFDIDAVGVAPVPEPATIILLGTGLLGLAGASRKKFKQ